MLHLYDNNASIPLRDGTKLSAVVWRPAEGAAPTLMVLSPYGNHEPATGAAGGGASYFPYVMSLVDAGYAVVWVECRGTYRSEGEFTPVVDEAAAAADALDWVVGQSWSNGRIGMYGPSYLGMTQWAAASGGHPALKAIAPTTTSMNVHGGCWYSPGGLLSHSLVAFWHNFMYIGEEVRRFGTGTEDPVLVEQLLEAFVADDDLIRTRPIANDPLLARRWLPDLLDHPDYDEFWHAHDFTRSVDRMTAPALMVAGWFDLFLAPQLADWVRLRHDAGSEDARDGSRLIVGPWDHELPTGQYPDATFGPLGSCHAVGLTGEHIAFYDQWLKGEEPDPPRSPVRIFVMGRNEWRDEQDFPLPDTQYVDHYLVPGSLVSGPGPGDHAWSLAYDFDPHDPTPTMGGALLPSTFGLVGPVEQGDLAERADVLTFATESLASEVEVTGFVSATLFVSSTARDTDFTVKLIDVHPDGRAVSVCGGALRMRYRHGLDSPQLMQPGEIYEVEVSMAATSIVFSAGHRIRVDVSSSDFPHYDVNSNTGGIISAEQPTDWITATNTLYGGPAHPSRIVLPIIDRD